MYLCVKQQLKHLSKQEYQILRELAHTAKNLYNESIYKIRQYFFETGNYLPYVKNYHMLKNSENYRILNSNMAQQILKEADGAFKSFFALLREKKNGSSRIGKVRLPGYLPKDGFATLVVGFVRIVADTFTLPYSRAYGKGKTALTIRIPPVLKGRIIKEIRIRPVSRARFFEIQYTYEAEEEKRNLSVQKALAVDLGVDNLASCVTEEGKSFLIDGRRLKSINQWYNKENARLQSVKDKQKQEGITRRQAALLRRRNNCVRDYMSKAGKLLTEYCVEHNIGNLIVGYRKDFQKNSHLGKRNNQNFVNLPYGYLVKKLDYLCRMKGIRLILQEESYTSKASFFEQDEMPVYGEEENFSWIFSGKRIKRGVYENARGYRYHADLNGALNIMRKSNIVSLTALYARGEVDTPKRIRIA